MSKQKFTKKEEGIVYLWVLLSLLLIALIVASYKLLTMPEPISYRFDHDLEEIIYRQEVKGEFAKSECIKY